VDSPALDLLRVARRDEAKQAIQRILDEEIAHSAPVPSSSETKEARA
jgi:hypothetical protein